MSREILTRFMQECSQPSVRVGILMSGGGSNANQILLERNRYPNLDIISVITDQSTSNAAAIAKKYQVGYYAQNAEKLTKTDRPAYFEKLASYLRQEKITCLLYAGFMKIVSDEFLQEFPGINSHPADLRVVNERGHRKYVGMDVIQMALNDQAESVRCSCCVVDNPVDNGELISVSTPVIIRPDERHNPLALHARMKEEAEWRYYPRTIEKIAKRQLNVQNIPYIFTEADYD